MQLAYRHDERPGESYEALDGKKKSPDSTVNPGGSASGRDGFWRRGPSEHRNDPCVQHGRATRP